MNIHHSTAIAALLALGLALQGQENPAPAPAATPGDSPAVKPQSEMEQWIGATDAQWQDVFKKDVTDMYEAEMNKAKVQYITALEDGIKKASAASDLKGALALRDEQKRFGETQFFPEQDDAADAASVKQIRAVIRAQLAKVNRDRATRARGLLAKYDALLAHTQAQLTQRQRLDDAQLVQVKRDEVAAAWLNPTAVPVAERPVPVVPSVPAVSGTKPTMPAPTPRPPIGSRATPTFAKVEAQGTVVVPLTNGAKIFSDRDYAISGLPPVLEGYQFTQSKNGAGVLKFKVLGNGLVYMACTSRFGGGGNSGGGWKSEVTSEQQLQYKRWHKEKSLQFDDSEPSYEWWVFSRQCKTGEEFSIRTEKYVAPILLVK